MKKDILINNGYKILKEDKDYFYIEDKDGYCYNYKKTQISLNIRKICKNNIYTVENIKLYLKKNNIPVKLISTEFKDVNAKLIFEDINGHLFQRSWHKLFEKGTVYLCPECTKIHRGQAHRIPKEQVYQEYLNRGLILLEEYENNRKAMLCKDKKRITF